jgi:hypothetical protein
MEERSDGIVLRPVGASQPKLSWEETARAMAAAGEDWSDWESTAADGLNAVPWEGGRQDRVAESASTYQRKTARKK